MPRTPAKKTTTAPSKPRRSGVRAGSSTYEQRIQVFVEALMQGKSQRQAYRLSHPHSTSSDDTVDAVASRLAKDARVVARLQQLRAQSADEFAIRIADLQREAARVALSDVSKIYDHKTGKPLLPHQLDEDTRRAIKSFEIDELGRIRYQFWGKPEALNLLFKHKGMLEKDNEQKRTQVVVPVRIELVPLQPVPADPRLIVDEGEAP